MNSAKGRVILPGMNVFPTFRLCIIIIIIFFFLGGVGNILCNTTPLEKKWSIPYIGALINKEHNYMYLLSIYQLH